MARSHAGNPEPGSDVCFGTARAATDRGQRRLGQRRGDVRRRKSTGRRRDHLLSKIAASFWETETGSGRFDRASGGYAPREQAAGIEPRRLEHARETAAGSAGRAVGGRGSSGAAPVARELHRANDEGWKSFGNEAAGRT